MAGALDSRALFSISYGLYMVSSRSGDRLNGQIANTVIQVASSPPKIAVSINKKNLTHEFISGSGVFGVSVLDQTTPMTLIGRFGFRSGRDIDKFENVEHKIGQAGVPLATEHVLSVLEAKVVDAVDVGTHTLFVGELLSAEIVGKGDALTYEYYHKHLKGKTPKNAPSYTGPVDKSQDTQPQEGAKQMKYVCTVCGYVYDPEKGDPDGGIAPGTAFEDIPDDWVCPVCGASKSDFEPKE